MANRIKGITVEIGGDTTKLQTALKQVNTEIKHTQSELRDVNKLLKLDPGNTELISQKHKLLGQTLEETKNKLTSLKEAQKQAEQALAEGKISGEQYDALKREIIETEQALKSLERQGATTNQTLQNIAITGEKWQNTGQNIENVGRKMMPVSLAVAGLGVAAVKTASDFDSGNIQYIGVIIFMILIIMICIVLVLKFKRSQGLVLTTTDNYNGEKSKLEFTTENIQNELVIQMVMLPAEVIIDENKLVEITNSKVLAHVNNLVPGLAQVGNVAHNAVQAAQANGEVLYKAIIPAGTKLADSKAMENAIRGIYRGSDGIKGHGNLVAVEAQKGTAVVANIVAAAIGVASMVVGQYYMTQINAELGVISGGISKISDFQDNEYRSRVFSLVTHVKKIEDFQVEILENNELRLSKIGQLDSLEEESTQLLGQATW